MISGLTGLSFYKYSQNCHVELVSASVIFEPLKQVQGDDELFY